MNNLFKLTKTKEETLVLVFAMTIWNNLNCEYINCREKSSTWDDINIDMNYNHSWDIFNFSVRTNYGWCSDLWYIKIMNPFY